MCIICFIKWFQKSERSLVKTNARSRHSSITHNDLLWPFYKTTAAQFARCVSFSGQFRNMELMLMLLSPLFLTDLIYFPGQSVGRSYNSVFDRCERCHRRESPAAPNLRVGRCICMVSLYRVARKKPGTVDTVDFSGLCSDQQLSFFTLLDRTSFPQYNTSNTKIIKFGWELFILWVIFYGGLSFSEFARFPEFRGTINDKSMANPENDSP